MIIEDIAELNVLVRVFYGLKFGVDEEHLSELVRSPFFSKMFNEAVVEMTHGFERFETVDGSRASLDQWKLNQRSEDEREKILTYLTEIEIWENLPQRIQKKIIETVLSPFIFDKSDVKEIQLQLKNRKR